MPLSFELQLIYRSPFQLIVITDTLSCRFESSVFRGECSASVKESNNEFNMIYSPFKLSAHDINNRNNSDISK